MKKKLLLVCFFSIIGLTGWCQDRFAFEGSRHSIELSTGYPYSIPNEPYYTPRGVEFSHDVQYKAVWPTNLTLTYSYRITKLWAVGGRINTHGWFYREFSDSLPKDGKTGYDHQSITPSAFVRIYWLTRKHVAFYSSAGVGYDFGHYNYYPFFGKYIKTSAVPDLILAGMQGNGKRVYGLCELSYGIAGLGLLAGVGVRFP